MKRKNVINFIEAKHKIGSIMIWITLVAITIFGVEVYAENIVGGTAEQIANERTMVRMTANLARGSASNKKITSSSLTSFLNKYAGSGNTTVTSQSSTVLLVTFSKTGNQYEIDINSGPIFDANLGIIPPYIPTGYTQVAGTDLDTGFVVQDSSGNQFVWIEVPKTVEVYGSGSSGTAGLNITNFTQAELTKIETALKTYTTGYSSTSLAEDTWASYEKNGLTETQYNQQKKKMLKSIYQNGGFYIGRYETGSTTARNEENSSTITSALIKQNAYPYNYVNAQDAQSISSNFASNGYTSSLMFGIQWDLVMKYLENKGTPSNKLIGTDASLDWGNFMNFQHEITNTGAKYLESGTWVSVPSGGYNKPAGTSRMLTTGASESFCKQNIYDLAGNLYEITLEKYMAGGNNGSIVERGNYFNLSEVEYSAAVRGATDTLHLAGMSRGFRVALYKDEIENRREYDASNLDGNGTTGTATTTLKDLSGNFDATIYGSPTFGNGYISLNEGSPANTQYIDMGTILNQPTSTLKIKFSVSEVPSETVNILGNSENGGYTISVLPSGKISFVVWTESDSNYKYASSKMTVVPNITYDVTGVYDGTYAYLYVDGILHAKVATPGGNIKNPENNESMVIGANPHQGTVSSVGIAKMKVYKASVSPYAIHPETEYSRYYDASNLNGNGTTGTSTTTLKDLSGNNDATIYGSPTFGNGYISLNESGASNQYIDMGPILNQSKLTLNLQFSTSEIPSETKYLMSNQEGGGIGVMIGTSGKIWVEVLTESGTNYEGFFSNTVIQTNTIYDVTAIYDGSYLYLYVNGQLENSRQTSGGNITNGLNNENMIIGANPYQNSISSIGITKMKMYKASISPSVIHP